MSTTTEPHWLSRRLPSGQPVDPGGGSMTDPHNAPAVVAERIAWHRETFKIGDVVRRGSDGCLIRITQFLEPTVGGYVYALGTHIWDGKERGISFRTGPLSRCYLEPAASLK